MVKIFVFGVRKFLEMKKTQFTGVMNITIVLFQILDTVYIKMRNIYGEAICVNCGNAFKMDANERDSFEDFMHVGCAPGPKAG